jgi:anti-sigma28 factor (negative regulator of flagellin synthesis)
MSDVGPISQSHAAAAAKSSRFSRTAQQAALPQRPTDSIELSDHARLLSKISQLPEIRQDLVDRVRSEIESGSYNAEAKIDTVIERLAEDL